ncbi:MAG: bifunctional phosphopantothenoylcysteine decarboxylase/phosphopantothenate--cysteine ligase CoaBC [Oscillospiraceae bacterium]|nr:bifunctional phosphopantothenoylcysteine decarboxylase/phosphopantothenate--cysteine ligase CoaBC [Oscillospiraceae bacterium]
MLKGKSVLIGITGGIAAYKIAGLCSSLVKLNAETDVMMTQNACQFITPLTFETLTNRKCMTDTFDRCFEFDVKHISAAKKADVLLIAPATANVIGKLANGIADDMLTTTALACTCPKIIAPAMNTNMYLNPVVQDNLKKLEHYGWTVIPADSGRLACGDSGKGKMPSENVLLSYILKEIACEKDLTGKKVLITAGATREAIDPVRFITNHSTGKMGYATAYRAMLRGADVTLVTGQTSIEKPPFVNVINVTSALEMYNAVLENSENADIIIMAAAVADYRPETVAENKIKKSDSDAVIKLERTDDILAEVCRRRKEKQFICGFSMETENLIENSRKKLAKKGCDMIAANSLKTEGAGFGTDTNIITLITADSQRELPVMSKESAADIILDEAVKHFEC